MRILTAGYGNRGFDGFIALMHEHRVTHLVDVRAVPQSSYWEDFRRERLHNIVPPTGIRYVYMGDTLGGTRNVPYLCQQDPETSDLTPVFESDQFRTGLDRLIEAGSDERRVICLMCGCLRPHKCHRSRLIGEALLAQGVEVFHLSDTGEPVAHAQVMEEAKPLQESLF